MQLESRMIHYRPTPSSHPHGAPPMRHILFFSPYSFVGRLGRILRNHGKGGKVRDADTRTHTPRVQENLDAMMPLHFPVHLTIDPLMRVRVRHGRKQGTLLTEQLVWRSTWRLHLIRQT